MIVSVCPAICRVGVCTQEGRTAKCAFGYRCQEHEWTMQLYIQVSALSLLFVLSASSVPTSVFRKSVTNKQTVQQRVRYAVVQPVPYFCCVQQLVKEVIDSTNIRVK